MKLSRRSFLRNVGIGAATLTLANLRIGHADEAAAAETTRAAETAASAGAPPDYRGPEDVWRRQWKWDKVVFSSHLRANCISACSWNVFVKDGLVWREEQNAVYEPPNAGVPDMNPRGCQKGGCYSALMYEPSGITHPLTRAGAGGDARWTRLEWDAALTELADELIDVALESGPDAVVYDNGSTQIDFGPSTASEIRFFSFFGATIVDSWAGVGDLPMGALQTWGNFAADGTSDDWFHSDYLLIWIANPVSTRIPDAHFFWEARYKGATVVTIAPDYSPSAIHADVWLNPKVGTDAALGLAMANVILGERLFKADYVREQTDLPFLVRTDTGRYLRESDLARGGKDDVFYVWDERAGAVAKAPGSQGHGTQSLALGSVVPALEGTFSVQLSDGRSVSVRPLLEILREHLASYTPEKAAPICGVGANTIRRIARDMARAKSALIYASWGSCKHYHSDLMQRTMCLLMALTGNQGRRGGGVRPGAWWTIDAMEELSGALDIPLYLRVLTKFVTPTARQSEAYMDQITREHPFTATIPFLYVHGGLKEVADRPDFNDPALPRGTADYVREATEKGWLRVCPPADQPPRVYFYTGGNPLRRWPAPQIVRKTLWPKLDLIVGVNPRMSSTGLESDFLLPASAYYERIGLKYAQSMVPYIIFGDQAVDPLGKSKCEWEIFGLLARKVQERARARGVKPFRDRYGTERDYGRLYDNWSKDGAFHEDDEASAMDYIIQESPATKGFTWKDAREKGLLPVQSTGHYAPHSQICSDWKPGETLYPQRWFVEGKQPWPTLTGRQQFLIDHPWYAEAGEALPVHKDPPTAGGKYPLRLTGGHTRWSIHALWRTQRDLLRLQRGQPIMWINADDARARGLRDNDEARVYNDVGSFVIHVRPSPAVRPGQVIVYHAWENFQFRNWMSSQVAVPSPWKPLHLLGGYGHLRYRCYGAAPSHGPRGTTVEVERADRHAVTASRAPGQRPTS